MKLELFYVVKQLNSEPHPNPRIQYDLGPYKSFNQALEAKNDEHPHDDSYIVVSAVEEVW